MCYTVCRTKVERSDNVFIEIKANSDVPIYLQLAQQLIEGIARGDLKPGESLPSVRAFAADLGMNMHTVNKAYHYLEEKEFIQIVAKSGVIIHPNGIPKASENQKQQIADQIRPLLAEGLVLKLSEEEMAEMIRELVRNIKEGKQ
ncbi:GntR family transcriptional regulator [Psychrobacillus sp. L3]|uniref:GntR family transcriptional regulator n=1 Tax=Psychrobacillus sp. L3 TaxID=3236891 RepID=UPI0036F40D88